MHASPTAVAITNPQGHILFSRGGSSTKRHLMVYPNETQAAKALRSPWIKQHLNGIEAHITPIWDVAQVAIPEKCHE